MSIPRVEYQTHQKAMEERTGGEVWGGMISRVIKFILEPLRERRVVVFATVKKIYHIPFLLEAGWGLVAEVASLPLHSHSLSAAHESRARPS